MGLFKRVRPKPRFCSGLPSRYIGTHPIKGSLLSESQFEKQLSSITVYWVRYLPHHVEDEERDVGIGMHLTVCFATHGNALRHLQKSYHCLAPYTLVRMQVLSARFLAWADGLIGGFGAERPTLHTRSCRSNFRFYTRPLQMVMKPS